MMKLAMQDPKEFAYEYFKGGGYTSVVRGEAFYIAKCTPVDVAFHPSNDGKCYNELPLVRSFQILKKYGTKRTEKSITDRRV